MSIIFSAEALADLTEIRAYIGQDNPFAASRIAVQLIAACDRLEYLPERGREITTVWPYVIVYRIRGDDVDIIRIRHGAQDR